MGARNIITIQGYKGVGKDRVGDMLAFCLNTPSFLHTYNIYRVYTACKLDYSRNQYHTVQYAEKLKQMIANLLNIDRKLLEDRDFKENYYVDFTTLTIYHKDNVDENKILNDTKFAKEIKRLDKWLTVNYYLSIRQILQYYGTQIMRHYFGQDIWILSTLKSKYNKIIITDQRFLNENQIATENNAQVIHITRPNTGPGIHSSEQEVGELLEKQKYNFLLNNDGNLEDLFNSCKELVKKL